MTRKQALMKAAESINDSEIKRILTEMADELPLTHWTEKNIFDSIEQFIVDNKRIPNVTDFKKKGLPPHSVIKLRFGIDLKDFLHKYYPIIKLCDSKCYYYKTKEEWKAIFENEYNRIKPTSAEEYNKERLDCPTWQTMSLMYNIGKWNEWVKYCDLKKFDKTKNRKIQRQNLVCVKNKIKPNFTYIDMLLEKYKKFI